MLLSFSFGCSAILNPYASDFSCAKMDNGKCVDLDTAYNESLDKTGKKNRNAIKKPCDGATCEDSNKITDTDGKDHQPTPDILYQQELQKKLAGLLRLPTTPILAPPMVMRVLILPYKGEDDTLYMQRYVYFIVDGPKFVMGDYLYKERDDK